MKASRDTFACAPTATCHESVDCLLLAWFASSDRGLALYFQFCKFSLDAPQ